MLEGRIEQRADDAELGGPMAAIFLRQKGALERDRVGHGTSWVAIGAQPSSERPVPKLWCRLSRPDRTGDGKWCPGEDSNLHALASAST